MPGPSSRHANYVELLTLYFKAHNPQQLPKIDKLLFEYHGRESQLFDKLEHKYGANVIREAATAKGRARTQHGHENIFEKLCDPHLYVGHHKHRFEAESGKGRGLEGRDRVVKGQGNVGALQPAQFGEGYDGTTRHKTDTTFTCPSQYLIRPTAPRPSSAPSGARRKTRPLVVATQGLTQPADQETQPGAARSLRRRRDHDDADETCLQSATPREEPGREAPATQPAAAEDLVVPPIFEKLTDPKQYTGAHKHRFDETGKGRGLQGRDYTIKGGAVPLRGGSHWHGYFGDTNTATDVVFHCPSQFLVRGENNHAKTVDARHAAMPKPATPNDKQPAIFDKLTDPKLYTGHHKHRFDDQGHGKGLDGRDFNVKGGGIVMRGGDHWHRYKGDTNTGTDVVFHCPSQFLTRLQAGTRIRM